MNLPLPRVAPGALIRTALLHRPAEAAPGTAFRAALAELVVLERELAALAPDLGDALYASRAGHTEEFHRAVVLPLRRAVHNGREPRPALLRALDGLPGRLPELRAWLAVRDRREEVLTALRPATGPALAAARSELAGLCREPSFLRAASFTSADLLRAVTRAGEDRRDRRARKEEAGVVRHATRAFARTTPLSAFTGVGWGLLPAPSPPDRGTTSWHRADLPLDASRTVVRANRTLVDTLFAALASDPRRRATLPHRMCSSVRITEGRAALARSRTAFTAARFLAVEDDEVSLGASAPLQRLAALCDPPARPDVLAALLAKTAAGAEADDAGPAQDASPERADAAAAFVRQVRDAGLLVPVPPFHPQDPAPLPRLADWLRSTGSPQDRALARRVEAVAADTDTFAAAGPDHRSAVLASLRERWAALLGEAGRPVGPAPARLTVLSEDVVLRRPVRLDGFLDTADHRALGELASLAEVFDLGPEVRRQVRDAFVARYGPGGVCAHVWDFGAAASEAWQRAARAAAEGARPGADGDGQTAAGGVRRLAELRAGLVNAVHRAHSAGGCGPDDEVVLPVDTVAALGSRMPPWAARRPSSYTAFLQRGPDGELCVNHLYGGWGRFGSRFLDALAPAAARETGAAVSAALGPGARVAQVRPVNGFNANLHPLFVPDEIGADRSLASLGVEDVELVHDPVGDDVRVRVSATGAWVDVLYAGVLAPLLLEPRLAPLVMDHPHGITDFGPLVPRHVSDVPGGRLVRTPRLRHRHLVLRRRRWELAGGTVAALTAELAAEGEVPVRTVARWRALLGVPDQLFLRAAPPRRSARVDEDLLRALDRPKPQYLDLGDALHLRCLARWLARHPGGAVLEEALPAPVRGPGSAAVELAVETYRAGRPTDGADGTDGTGTDGEDLTARGELVRRRDER
ncbi:lantibiotic dehydratase [Streptomyces sp. CAI 127]|uniref:lantibiotic dehydratase n=1 Tax=Streptomyces sp. CAI 127 TaxID=1076397 RepID=UPI0028156835|nr:lantibiotic dehydratase [Streptomyces sp. CAI 127]